MKKKRVNKLYINFAYIALVISTTAFAITGLNKGNKSDNENTNYVDNTNTTIEYDSSTIGNEEAEINVERVDVQAEVSRLLAEETKTYSGMNLSHEYEDYIRGLCDTYAENYNLNSDELFQNVLVIGDQESDGKWNNNGVISPTNDYGEFQINITNHDIIERKLGYTSEDLLNDQYKNAEAAVWMISNIMCNEYCNNIEDVYGMYNGWINWAEKEDSVKYVDSCLARNDLYFASGVVYEK